MEEHFQNIFFKKFRSGKLVSNIKIEGQEIYEIKKQTNQWFLFLVILVI